MTHLRRDPVTPGRDGSSRHPGPHSTLPLRLLLSLQHFPPLCKRARAGGREGGRGSGVAAGSKKGPALSEPRAKCRRYSNQAVWVRPNCLRVLLTPSAPQTSRRRHKRQKATQVLAKGLVALIHLCSPELLHVRFYLFY